MENQVLNNEQRKLISDNMDLVEFTAGKYFHLVPNFDDMISAAEEEICRAALLYNPEKNANFRTFATKTMIQNLKHHLRDLVPQYIDDEGNTVHVTVMSIDSLVSDEGETNEEELTGEDLIPSENPIDAEHREEMHNKFQLLMKGLSKKARKLVLSRFGFRSQKSLQEMAAEMRISDRAIYEKVNKIMVKLAKKANNNKKIA